MLELIAPTSHLRDSWLTARDEWGHGVQQDGSGLQITNDVDTVDGFAAWVERLRRQADESIPMPPDRVHATY